MQDWEPIVKKQVLETFVTESQTQTIVGAIFTSIGLMILASFLAFLFYWSYQKDKMLMMAIFCGIVFFFAIKMLILIAIIRNKLNAIVFRVYMGSTVFMCVMSLLAIIFFAVKASQRIRGSSSSSSAYDIPAPRLVEE